ncbi:hypothetical protein HA402_001515 [Bradysia odoriphaga]|nr:hypothetical protein HA402_001515 [Bradysia odoriphaga]
MKFAYKFSNLLGTIYKKGNVIFTPDGNTVVSPVGNKITIYDLKTNKATTLALESKFNYTSIDISPNGCLLVAVNEKGAAQMISLVSNTVVHTYKFSSAARCVKFSPDGAFFAIAKENMVFVFQTPGEITGEYNSFVLRRYFFGAHDDIVWIDWSCNSKVLIVGSRDNSIKVYSIELYENFRPYLLGGHTDSIVGCFFEANSLDVNTVSRNGQSRKKLAAKKGKIKEDDDDDDIDTEKTLEKSHKELEKSLKNAQFIEGSETRDQQGKLVERPRHPFYYKRIARHYLLDEIKKENRKATLTAATYHKKSKLLVTAYSTGAFYLHELPDVSLIHSLSISEYAIDTACFNPTGDWIALGAAGLGQLLVWEWQSEQYVMKQQGHASEMSCIAYSSDGQYIVTGGEDAKVKLWNVSSGFCFVTFHEHTSAVTAVEFSNSKRCVLSASLDGTVRAYDILRYRNFRTFTSPRLVQFCSVAVDYSGEFVVAGAQDVFEVYLWSMKFGRLLEILSGHEGPVTSLQFSPTLASTTLVSGSWDKSIKIWNCVESSADHETIDISADVTAIAFKPNGEEIAVAAINGNIQMFNVKTSQQVGSIEGRNDLGSGVSKTDLITAKKNLQGKYFSTIAYSADGSSLLAAGRSKNVCIYNVKDGILLKKFEVTQNRSLDALDDFINRRNITEFGNMALVEKREALEGGNVNIRLPGVQKGDMASRNYKPEIRVFSVRFSPTAQSWAAATTEGLLIYALDKGVVFDPFNLSLEVTPKATRDCLKNGEYSTALIMALKLNEASLVQEIIEKIPHKDVELIVRSLPDAYAERTLQFIAKYLNSSHHVEFYLNWACSILTFHGPKENILSHQSLLTLHQSLSRKYELLSKVCDFNKYTMQVLLNMSNEVPERVADGGEESDDENLILIQSNGNGGVGNSDDDDEMEEGSSSNDEDED